MTVLTEKYRPQKLHEVVGQPHLIERLKVLINNVKNGNFSMPNLLFSGPTGTGKTTTARIVMSEIIGDLDYKPLILNASKERGIDVIRNNISEYVRYRAHDNIPFKFIFLDEADRLTKEAQWSLRAIMEDHTNLVRFILSCEEISKVIPAIQGRCGRFSFKPIPAADVYTYLAKIAKGDKIRIKPKAGKLLAEECKGNLRLAVNNLATLAMTHENGITERDVTTVFGYNQEATAGFLIGAVMREGEDIDETYFQAVSQGMTINGFFNNLINTVAGLDIPHKRKANIIFKASEAEYHVIAGCSEDIQMRAFLYWLREVL